MSSTTSRVSLYKPAGGENVNVTTDLNNNWDKVDSNLNFRVAANAAARNAISPFWAGLNVRDTDTGKLWVSNGSAPISGSWKEIPVQDSTFGSDLDITAGKQVNIGGSSSVASFATSLAASGDDAIASRVSTDTQSRYLVKADGKTWWGPGGSTAIDTNLYRDSASVLATDDEFMIKGGNLILTAGGTAEKNAVPSSSTSLTASTAETVVAVYSIPANDMIAGAVYKLTAFGTVNTAATPPTLQIRGRIGGVAGSQFATTNAVAQTASVTTRVFKAEIYMVCLTTGASGTVFGNLDVYNGAATGVPGTVNPTNFNNTTAVSSGHIMDGSSTSTVNTTTALDLVLTGQWASSNAAVLVIRGFAGERIA